MADLTFSRVPQPEHQPGDLIEFRRADGSLIGRTIVASKGPGSSYLLLVDPNPGNEMTSDGDDET